MVIEYAGELVRPSVAEARERRCYNSLVGSGTYIFRLNANECVDATRCGNLAHLLNHSCSPNCHSRSIPVWNAAEHRTIDKVVIFAVRDIDPGEELTYDYRFCGEEVLRCDCGAKECRGTVNIGDIGGGAGGGGGGDAGNAKAMTVPKSQVRWLLSGSNEKDLH
jgi:SET domain-containing protein